MLKYFYTMLSSFIIAQCLLPQFSLYNTSFKNATWEVKNYLKHIEYWTKCTGFCQNNSVLMCDYLVHVNENYDIILK